MILATIFITIEISGLALMWWAVVTAAQCPDEIRTAQIIPFPQRDVSTVKRRSA